MKTAIAVVLLLSFAARAAPPSDAPVRAALDQVKIAPPAPEITPPTHDEVMERRLIFAVVASVAAGFLFGYTSAYFNRHLGQ